MKLKKFIYITCFIITGIMLSTIVHGLIEIPVIYILISDFEKYGLGLSWGQWYIIHHIGTVILLVLGVVLGYFFSVKFWKKTYENKNKLIYKGG